MFLWTECGVPFPGIPVPGDSAFFLLVSEPELKKFGTEKSLGTGLENILVPKKVLEPESKKCGTEKESRNRSRNILVPKKSRNRSQKILVLKKILEPGPKFFRILVLIWVPVSSRSRDLFNLCNGIGTGLEKNLVPKEVSERVSKKNWF